MIDYPVFDEQGRPVVQSAEGGRPAVPPGQTEQPGNRPDTPPGHDENHPGNKPETPPGQEKPKPDNELPEEDEEEEATPKEKGRYADSPLSVMAVDEVDGAYNLDEVHVLHLAGPYAGMTLVHRKDAEGLAEAHAAGLVLGPVGYDPNETSELTSTLYEEDGETPINSSPSSYPHSAVLSLSGKTAGNAAPRGAEVTINGEKTTADVRQTGEQTYALDVSFPEAGSYDISVLLDTLDHATAHADLNGARRADRTRAE